MNIKKLPKPTGSGQFFNLSSFGFLILYPDLAISYFLRYHVIYGFCPNEHGLGGGITS